MTRITAIPRGPLVIEGDIELIELIDMNGNRVDVSDRTKIRLCRCGASGSKPLCDGSHNRVGFEARG